jgi:hypothetical protein
LRGFVWPEVFSALRGVITAFQFAVRGERISQKLRRLSIATSQKSLADVEHH